MIININNFMSYFSYLGQFLECCIFHMCTYVTSVINNLIINYIFLKINIYLFFLFLSHVIYMFMIINLNTFSKFTHFITHIHMCHSCG